jgi:hypothetical protein
LSLQLLKLGKGATVSESSRSRSYPAINLPEALEVLRKQVEGLGEGAHDREAIAQALGYTSGTSGIAARKIAALVQFGLLWNQRGLYEPTKLAREILAERDENRLKEKLRAAFLHAGLFHEIVQDYLAKGQVPRLLAHALRSYRIVHNARDEVARIFMDSALHARVMDSNGIFEKDFFASMGQAPPEEPAAPAEEPAVEEESPHASPQPSEFEGQVLRFYLTDGKLARWLLPLRLNEQDLAILRAQLTMLETQVQVNKPAAPLRWSPRPERGSGQS